MARLETIAARLAAAGADLRTAPPIPPAALRTLHEPVYVDAVVNGAEPLASSSHLRWTASLRDACLHMLGGQLAAATAARVHGSAFNIACGFHHALPGRGGGFCTFNGFALVAQHFPAWRIAVLDCDEHGGDGTEAFCALLPNLRQVSVFGTRFGIRGGLRSRALPVPRGEDVDTDRAYLQVLDQALDELLSDPPDLLLYQAGMDSHRDDPKSTLRLSAQTLAARDHRVFSFARRAGIAVLAVPGGAYQDSRSVAELYVSTWRAACDA
ncbi:MAG TPA: hypothetical protein VF132_03120 [Rudaea sp.]